MCITRKLTETTKWKYEHLKENMYIHTYLYASIINAYLQSIMILFFLILQSTAF